jgi:hypothetical protein
MVNKVIDYQIVEANIPTELSKNVKQAMADDWVPSGPLVHTIAYFQVMVKFAAET